MSAQIAVTGRIIRYYGTDYTIRNLAVDDSGVAIVDLDPANETITSAIKKVVKADSTHNINFPALEKELLKTAPPDELKK